MMKKAIVLSASALGALALPQPGNPAPYELTPGGCCFQLTAHGPSSSVASGVIGQLDDGQLRIGGNHGNATLCWERNRLKDDKKRGCIITPPTSQIQCDQGVKPHVGFVMDCGARWLILDGVTDFFACPVNDFGEWNVYKHTVKDQLKCVGINITTSIACSGACKTGPSTDIPPPGEEGAEEPQQEKPQQEKPQQEKPQQEKPQQEKPQQEQPKPKILTPRPPIYDVPNSPTETAVLASQAAPVVGGSERPEQPPAVKETPKQEAPKPQAPSSPVPKPSAPPVSQPPATPSPKPASPAPKPSDSALVKPPAPPVPQPPAPPAPTESVHYEEAASPSVKISVACTPREAEPTGGTQTENCSPKLIKNQFEFPHLIVPVDKAHPDKAVGNVLSPVVSPNECSVFNFDIRPEFKGKTCTLVFLLPHLYELETSTYNLTGTGGLEVSFVKTPATAGTTWSNLGEASPFATIPHITPGGTYVIASHECSAGERKAWRLCAKGDVNLWYFQDFNPAPLGLYITVC